MVKSIKFMFFCLLFSMVLSSACDQTSDDSGPDFYEAWVRAVPGGVNMTAGFGTMRNPGNEPIHIKSFSSPSFGSVSLHHTELEDGVSRMREIPVLSIEPRSSFVLEPGGYHLMLMMPSEEIQPGDSVVVEMAATDGRVFSFTIPVERR